MCVNVQTFTLTHHETKVQYNRLPGYKLWGVVVSLQTNELFPFCLRTILTCEWLFSGHFGPKKTIGEESLIISCLIDQINLMPQRYNNKNIPELKSTIYIYNYNNKKNNIIITWTDRWMGSLVTVTVLGLGLGRGAGLSPLKALAMAATLPLSKAFTERRRWSSIVCLASERLRWSAALDFFTAVHTNEHVKTDSLKHTPPHTHTWGSKPEPIV